MIDYKDGHNKGDVEATGKGWLEMNCYLEETASGFSSLQLRHLSSLDSIPRLDSESPIMHLRFRQILQIQQDS